MVKKINTEKEVFDCDSSCCGYPRKNDGKFKTVEDVFHQDHHTTFLVTPFQGDEGVEYLTKVLEVSRGDIPPAFSRNFDIRTLSAVHFFIPNGTHRFSTLITD
jgi:hypothetical protein